MEEQSSKIESPAEPAEPTAEIKEAADSHIGKVIDGRYEILALLGKGGMGSVYRVREISSGTEYALKMIAPEVADQKILAKRLEHEAIAAKTLTHANIAAIYAVGQAGSSSAYLIMDLIEGKGLDELLKTELVLKPDRAINIFVQIADALVHAHYKGVIHRDLKPSNILLKETSNGQEIVKIVDFGIAKVADTHSSDKTKLTQTGELIGTPLYMSPEQCRGDELDGRADIYSLGCIMYEVLAGTAPFTDKNPLKVLLGHINEIPPELPKSAAVSPDLRFMIRRCLEKDPIDRYSSAQALLTDLERTRDGKSLLQRKAPRRTVRKRIYILASAAASIALGALALWWSGQVQQPASKLTMLQPLQELHRPETYKDKTLSEWTNLIEQSPDNAEFYFNRGQLHDRRDERTNAIDDYTHAIALKPDYIAAIVRRAYVYTMIADYKNALKDAEKVISLDPESEEGYKVRAFANVAMERYPQAREDIQKALKINEVAPEYYQLAEVNLKLGDYESAREAAERSITLGQEYVALPSYEGVAGVIATFTRDFPGADAWLTKATNSQQARGVEWQELAYYYVCTGKIPEAEQAIRQAKALETFPARGYRIAGELYRTAGNYEQALKELSASTSLEEYPPGYRQKAVTYLSMGQWRSAYEDLLKSAKLNPYSPITLSYLALVENHLGLKKEATDHIAKAFVDRDVPPIDYANRAAIELSNKDLKKALADANQAISIDPWLKEAYVVRSAINAQLNKASEAQSDADKAKALVSHLDL